MTPDVDRALEAIATQFGYTVAAKKLAQRQSPYEGEDEYWEYELDLLPAAAFTTSKQNITTLAACRDRLAEELGKNGYVGQFVVKAPELEASCEVMSTHDPLSGDEGRAVVGRSYRYNMTPEQVRALIASTREEFEDGLGH